MIVRGGEAVLNGRLGEDFERTQPRRAIQIVSSECRQIPSSLSSAGRGGSNSVRERPDARVPKSSFSDAVRGPGAHPGVDRQGTLAFAAQRAWYIAGTIVGYTDIQMNVTLFAVVRTRGAGWQLALPMEEQVEWDAHAAFMNGLEREGFVLLGGPLEGTADVLLIIRAAS